MTSDVRHEYIDGDVYAMVGAHSFIEIEFWSKDEQGIWQQSVYYLGDEVPFSSIDLKVQVEEIYRNVQNENMLAWLEKEQQDQAE